MTSSNMCFGATGAAALYRRKMIDDISIDGEFSIPISSPTKIRMSPGALSYWAGNASTRPGHAPITFAVFFLISEPAFRQKSTCIP